MKHEEHLDKDIKVCLSQVKSIRLVLPVQFKYTFYLREYLNISDSSIMSTVKLEVITDNWTQKFEPHVGQISKP